jgi:hypothetical protein
MGRASLFIAAFAVCAVTVASAHAADSGAPLPAAYQVKDWSSVRIHLRNYPCIASCPDYDVEIRGDGTVAYKGTNCVAVKGEASGRADAADVKKLFAMFAAIDFLALHDEYKAPEATPDSPLTIVTLTFDGRSKTVKDWLGASAGMPKEVTGLEDAVDRTANDGTWIYGTRECFGQTIHDAPSTH